MSPRTATGNKLTKASDTGIETAARIWPLGNPTEDQDRGFLTRSRYGLRFSRSWPHVLGAQSKVQWQGRKYSVVGDPVRHNGSARTRHIHYQLERSVSGQQSWSAESVGPEVLP
ncbi:hypothetical protein [Mycolicibacterium tusciae]|uniref:hypothetical protein n=1 Tax=Mycolicibacterium tusciae TaxID=75922 RepID=UPI0009F71FEB|nr:hypothetical protein [Mycolicibacterium tusciae]